LVVVVLMMIARTPVAAAVAIMVFQAKERAASIRGVYRMLLDTRLTRRRRQRQPITGTVDTLLAGAPSISLRLMPR